MEGIDKEERGIEAVSTYFGPRRVHGGRGRGRWQTRRTKATIFLPRHTIFTHSQGMPEVYGKYVF